MLIKLSQHIVIEKPLINLAEIEDNDYNLNIPRYVDTFEEEEPIDLDQVQQELTDIDKEIAKIELEINKQLKELGVL